MFLLVFLSVVMVGAQEGSFIPEEQSPWVTRFNHELGITFDVPPDFRIHTTFLSGYSNPEGLVFNFFDRNTGEGRFDCIENAPGDAVVEILRIETPTLCKHTRTDGDTRYYLDIDSVRTDAHGNAYTHLILAFVDEALRQDAELNEQLLRPVAESVQFQTAIDPIEYVDAALEVLESNYVYIDRVDWPQIQQDTMAIVDADSSGTEAYTAIRYALEQLQGIGVHDNGLSTPVRAEEIATSQQSGALGFSVVSPDEAGGYPQVYLVFPDSPAQEAGLRVGDWIETINGVDFYEASGEDRNADTVTLGIRRSERESRIEMTMTRTQITTFLTPTARRLENDIGYIEYFSFSPSPIPALTEAYTASAHAEIARIDADEPTCGWIVDMRRNNGGNEFAMGVALGPIRGEGRWYGKRDRRRDEAWFMYIDGNIQTVIGPPPGGEALVENPYSIQQENPPVAVLVSPLTASFGEITAKVFQDRARASTRIFGETTEGTVGDKVVNWQLFDGSIMTFIDEILIDLNGSQMIRFVEPDEFVETDYTVYGTDDDPVIQAATAWLRNQPECIGGG